MITEEENRHLFWDTLMAHSSSSDSDIDSIPSSGSASLDVPAVPIEL